MGTTSEVYDTASAYRAALQERALVPRGFRFAVTATEFIPAELGAAAQPLPIKLTAILAPAASRAWAAVLTRNRVTGAPVEIVRGQRGQPVRGLVINNKVANVCAAGGEAAARSVLASVGDALGVPAAELLPASTGVIGWQLPVAALAAAAPALAANLGTTSALAAAEAIMTTDAYAKLRSATTACGHRVLGIAKGAGMIEPDMGTMLAFIVTDAPATAAELQEELQRAARSSFNAITVDGDQSTSDMAVLLSSAERAPGAPRVAGLGAAVRQVCTALAGDIVRNGEGTRHVMEIAVTSHLAEADALAVAKAVGNGPLVKTAVYGNDPNVGRIAGAVGDYLGSRPDLRHLWRARPDHLARRPAGVRRRRIHPGAGAGARLERLPGVLPLRLQRRLSSARPAGAHRHPDRRRGGPRGGGRAGAAAGTAHRARAGRRSRLRVCARKCRLPELSRRRRPRPTNRQPNRQPSRQPSSGACSTPASPRWASASSASTRWCGE